MTATTRIPNFWDQDHPRFKEWQSLNSLIPEEGYAETIHGELVRGVNRIMYDMYNNGGGNMIEEVAQSEFDYYFYDSEIDEEVFDHDAYENDIENELDEYYEEIFDFLKTTGIKAEAEARDMVLQETSSRDWIDSVLNALAVEVMDYIKTNPDKPFKGGKFN